ncbi:tripartite tricarboxylate transporter TctB family protein [Pseudogracilibacillus auburnensis]|uniref:tripartite tricarboxylate transporter TctB family protein n=1 Tax=Pseudogracilibacillus auburnensis TaxID=1494959 RepID=UPI001A95D210|nr:tripartite tricarboxylate transporter TctB family protein [Pseudogracilibacillus auburnensis]MBO1004284.1 tripartite tricarboxylate transporter TctB family protein [Pseudogracilibacillus auburnensis]
MGRNKFSILLYIIVGLAVIGLVSSLINNPGKFLISILVAIGVAFVIFMIFTRILHNRSPGANDEMKKYRRAAKQSNRKYTNQNEHLRKRTTKPASPLKTRKKRRHVPHLTVIEGKKTNKDNDDRASN